MEYSALYAKIRPERYDLFNHMSAAEMFFIDGDSLLLHVVTNRHVNWELSQTVHVVYLALQLLHDLASRGGRYHVVFFESNEWIWAHAPQKRLLRAVLRLALKQRAKEPEAPFSVFEFPDWHGEKFSQHVDAFQPEFIYLNDGEQVADDAATLIEGEVTADAKTSRDAAVRMLHKMVAAFLSRGVHVAFNSRLIHKDNAIVAFVARSTAKVPPDAPDAPTLTAGEVAIALLGCVGGSSGVNAPASDAAAPLAPLSEALLEASDTMMSKEISLGAREAAVFLGLRIYLETRGAAATAAERSLAKALIATTVAMRVLDVKTRAQPRGHSAELSSFLSAIAPSIARVVSHVLPECDFDATSIDLIDGNLFFTLTRLVASGKHASFAELFGENENADDLDRIWAFVSATKKAKMSDEPLTLPTALDEVDEVAPAPNVATEPAHPLVAALTQRFNCTPPSRAVAPSGHGAAVELQRQKQWHMAAGLVDMDEPPEDDEQITAAVQANVPTWKRLRMQRNLQRMGMQYLNAIMDTAQSMEGVAFLFANESQCIVDDKKEVKDAKDAKVGKAAAAAASNRQKKAKTATLTQKEIIRRENTIRLATGAMNNAYKTLRDNIDNNVSVETLDKFVQRLKLSKLRSGEDEDADAKAKKDASSSSDDDDSDDEAAATAAAGASAAAAAQRISPLRAAFNAFVGPRNECDVLFEKDKSGSITGLQKVAAFVDAQEALHKAKKETVLTDFSFETKSKLQLMFIAAFENHLRFIVLHRKMEIADRAWRAEKERSAKAQEQHNARKVWESDEERNKSARAAEPDLSLAVAVFRTCHACYSLIERTHIRVLEGQRNSIRAALRNLDFQESYYQYVDKLSEKFEDPTGRFHLRVGPLPRELAPTRKLMNHTAARFQMNHMGHLMERHVCPTADKRVPFNPDDWQRELLDIVDKRGSAVVCAPTSAGKTFISYYCMKRVLRESNEDVVVYVAPSRALVNQAVADVYCRFGKKEYRESGLSVFGVLGGRDFVRSPFKCQVLVTVPEALETILMSPLHQQWCRRIKYVIFDEIHSIDNFGNGSVWERLLMMVRAPFVALSATLGETTELCEWLNRVQKRQEQQWHRENPARPGQPTPVPDQTFSVSLVPSGGAKIQRWSDIQKYVFLPPPEHKYELHADGHRDHAGLNRAPTVSSIVPLHPLSCISLEMLRTKYPPDLTLVPSESIQLFDHMSRLWAPIQAKYGESVEAIAVLTARLQKLNPDVYFADDRQITQRRSREYEATLRTLLMDWGATTTSAFWRTAGVAKEIRKPIREDCDTTVRHLLSGASHAVELGEAALAKSRCHTFDFVKENILPALHQLKSRNLLPAIVFNFEQDQCVALAMHVVEALENAEAVYRKTDAFRRYELEMRARKELQQAALKTLESQKKDKRSTKDEDGKFVEKERDTIDVDTTANYDIPDILPQFTFASGIAVVDAAKMDEIDEALKQMPWLRRAIQRGVGIHHPGISGKLRGYVEKLFRMKHLPVVFATETLALGIHSPCRSVIMAGDHVLLNTMQFRQMSGRAGRRGMDFLGHVMFIGVSFRKIRRLLTSDLMVLKGHVQLDVTTQLRLLQLHDYLPEDKKAAEVDFHAVAQDIAECLTTEPLFKQGREAMNVVDPATGKPYGPGKGTFEAFQVYHFRRILSYFFQQGLHYPSGKATLGDIVTRALNTYNDVRTQGAAFIFADLLSSLTLHGLASATEVQEVMAHIFSVDGILNVPLEVHPSARHDIRINPDGRTHRVMLPPLDERYPAVARALARTNNVVLTLMTQLAVDIATTLEEIVGVDRQLPIPFISVDDKGVEKKRVVFPKASAKDAPVAAELKATAIPYVARSPFVALSGVGDRFECGEDLQQSLRAGLFFDAAHLPLLDFEDLYSHSRGKFLINAAIVDFDAFESQQVEGGEYRRIALESMNGLSPSASYAALIRFVHVIKNLDEALDSIAPDASEGLPADAVAEAIKALKVRWSELQNQLQNRKRREPTAAPARPAA